VSCLSTLQRKRPASRKTNAYYIPHHALGGRCFRTRERLSGDGPPHILKALQLLKQHPDYKFTLDQVAYLKPFLERYPERRRRFASCRPGRLEIVGGMDVMPDVVKPGASCSCGRCNTATLLIASSSDARSPWRGCSIRSGIISHAAAPATSRVRVFLVFVAEFHTDNWPAEFLWRGIDGAEIPAFWLRDSTDFSRPAAQPPEFTKFFKAGLTR